MLRHNTENGGYLGIPESIRQKQHTFMTEMGFVHTLLFTDHLADTQAIP